MIAQLRVRKDTNANWNAEDPVLAQGEIGETTDAPFLLKIGDGTAAWTTLQSFAIPDGGAVGEVLAKASAADRDLTWSTAAIPAQVTVYDTVQAATAWAKPVGCRAIKMVVQASGGGGGSGRRGAAASLRFGGNGGFAGSYLDLTIAAEDAPDTLYVTVGAAGVGGAAQTVDSSNGNPGTAGNPSFVSTSSSAVLATGAASSILLALGGALGKAGSTVTASNTTDPPWGWESGGPGAKGVDGTAEQPYNGGGGAGGVLSAANLQVGSGSLGATIRRGTYGWVGSGAPAAGAAGIAGSSSPTRIADVVAPGCGGSGGASNPAGPGGAGGAGDRGGGGGGGGASPNGSNSGAGGNGGVGFVIMTAIF